MQINPGDMVAFGGNTEPTPAHSGQPARRTSIIAINVVDTTEAFLVDDNDGRTWIIGKEDPTVEITTKERMDYDQAHESFVRDVTDAIENFTDSDFYVRFFVVADNNAETASVWRWLGDGEYVETTRSDIANEWARDGLNLTGD